MADADDEAEPEEYVIRGEPLDWSEAELEEMSRVTEADMDEAAADWRRNVPWPYGGLVDAAAEDDAGGEPKGA